VNVTWPAPESVPEESVRLLVAIESVPLSTMVPPAAFVRGLLCTLTVLPAPMSMAPAFVRLTPLAALSATVPPPVARIVPVLFKLWVPIVLFSVIARLAPLAVD
jgi:hypothetical protein